MVQLRYWAWKLSPKCLFEAFAMWFIIIWVYIWTSFEQHCCIIQHKMCHIHVYMGSRSNKISPPATLQGQTSKSQSQRNKLIISHSLCHFCHGFFIIQNTSKMSTNTTQNLSNVDFHCLTTFKVSNQPISHLLKLKLRSSNCYLLLTNGSCIWFHKYGIFCVGTGYDKSLIFKSLMALWGKGRVVIIISPLKALECDQACILSIRYAKVMVLLNLPSLE